jgi:DNA topoisomerase-1
MRHAKSRHAASHASLRFCVDDAPGITRRRHGRAFKYLTPRKRPVRPADLARIQGLAIPPAWQEVWISPYTNGHLQATGIDSRGRKQYRYHADWTHHRNLSKFDGLIDFAKVLPTIRRRIRRDMNSRGLAKNKVCACVVQLLDETRIRIGNAEYAKSNDSYGLTTILDEHARIVGGEIRFRFRAKSGKMCETVIHSPRAAKIAKHCQDLPGHELFGYIGNDGEPRDIQSGDVNDYLFTVSGLPITAKVFRTWGGTTVAAETLMRIGFPPQSKGAPKLTKAELKRRETQAVKAASIALYNTVSTCRKFYVHPGLIEAYADGRLAECFAKAERTATPRELKTSERAVLAFLRLASRP